MRIICRAVFTFQVAQNGNCLEKPTDKCTFWIVESLRRQQRADNRYYLKNYRLPKTGRQNCKYIFPRQIRHSAANLPFLKLFYFIKIILNVDFMLHAISKRRTSVASTSIVHHFDFVSFMEDTSPRIANN